MLIFILLWVSGISLVLLALMIGWQMLALRNGRVNHQSPQSLSAIIQPKVDQAAFHFSTFAGEVLKRLSLGILVGLRTALVIFKQLLTKVEKRFARVINAVKGKGAISKKGSVSLFLREVEQYRLEVQSVREGQQN